MERPRPSRALAIDFALLALTLVWGINYTVIKSALKEMNPLAFNAVRYVLATATIVGILRWRGVSTRLPKRDLLRLAALGVLANAVYQILFIQGVAHTSAANASLILALSPMMVAILAAALGRETIVPMAWVGIALAVTGLSAVLTARPAGGFVGGHLSGDLLMLLSALTWAVYTVGAAPILERCSSLTATMITFLSGTPVLLLFSLPGIIAQPWGAVGIKGWAGAFFSGVFAIGLGYLAWNAGLSRLGSARTAVYSNLTPVVTAAFGWVLLGERWTAWQFAGAAVVLVGIALTRYAGGSRADDTES